MNKNRFILNYAENSYNFSKATETFFVTKLIFNQMLGEIVLDLGCGQIHHVRFLSLQNIYERISSLKQGNFQNHIKQYISKFENVMQIGSIGGLETLCQFKIAANYLKPGGYIIDDKLVTTRI